MAKKETQLDRIERKLDWIIVETYNENIREIFRRAHTPEKDWGKFIWKLPRVSDVFKNRGK